MPASQEQREHAVERAAKIFALLKSAAERGAVCPRNKDLAERFGVKLNTIKSAFDFLEANGMIEVEQADRYTKIVTIIATGRRTADPNAIRRAA